MEYSAIVLVCVVGLLLYNEISTLKRTVKKQEKRLNQLAELTNHEEVSSCFVSQELKEQALKLKRQGKLIEAVKKIREHTQMDLVEAKRYVDQL